MNDNIPNAIWAAHQAIGKMPLAEGMQYLLHLAQEWDPEDGRLRELAKTDFVADARQIVRSVAALVEHLPVEVQYLYFGLDGLNMANGKGIEFGAARTNADERYSECRNEIPSPALTEIYRQIDSLYPDYLLAVGFLGMALRHGFSALSANRHIRQDKLEIRFGHHDGDLFPLGTMTPAGFELKLLEVKKPDDRVRDETWRQKWPRSTERSEWVIAMGEIAEAIADEQSYVRRVSLAVESLAESSPPDAPARLLERLMKRVDITDPKVNDSACEAACRLYLAAGQENSARSLLKQRWARILQKPGIDQFGAEMLRRHILTLGFSDILEDASPKEQLEATVYRLLEASRPTREVNVRDRSAAVREIEELLTRPDAFDLAPLTKALFHRHAQLDDRPSALRVLGTLTDKDRPLWTLYGPMIALGLNSEAITAAQEDVARAMQQAANTGAPNYHHYAHNIATPILSLGQAGERDEARVLMEKTVRESRSWDLSGWIGAAVDTCFARAWVGIGETEKADELLKRALSVTRDAEGLWEITQVLIEAKAWAPAIAVAKRIPSTAKRRGAMAAVLAKAARFDDLENVLAHVKTPEEACEIAWRVACA